MPFAAGEALALKLAGADEVKVFVVEGEGGLTPGAAHETKNSAWGLGLSNLVFLVDWNDFGIDERPASSVVHGTPEDWFAPYGWRVTGTPRAWHGARSRAPCSRPAAAPTRRASPASRGSEPARAAATASSTPPATASRTSSTLPSSGRCARSSWPATASNTRRGRAGPLRSGGAGGAGGGEPAGRDRRPAPDEKLVDWLSDRLLEIAATVPGEIEGLRLTAGADPSTDRAIFDFEHYPDRMWRKPGDHQPNRAALATWGSYVNAVAKRDFGRPLFIACSADLAESTNIAGFAKPFGEMPGFGNFERDSNPTGALLPRRSPSSPTPE